MSQPRSRGLAIAKSSREKAPNQPIVDLRVLIRKDDCGLWIAQGIEHDIVAQGDSLSTVKALFLRTFVAEVRRSIQRGRQALSDIPAAPGEFGIAYEQHEAAQNTLPSIKTDPTEGGTEGSTPETTLQFAIA